ncbi:carbohydrate-binding protein [Gilvimarinus agarilyticus]|uniref:carbohydrate-binding protein n=1 Tax=Gilvimarinus sp. 2_MG-2023 TaxID=3062666 RepID=UPI001C09B8B8|nr:carbohydrate-binding protein [Gilvimarinus sp. 2_MG-2023]MBU2886728.1 carbohydrate-binding protein [Gilvimarinus agarilyticus]MDO6571394.1 carbohydrate-binding protein [Gilvimarinus sp. 2_MG-2023]
MFSTVSQAQYVSTQGTKIVDENGDELFLSGINLGNWLLWEGYLMMGDFNYRTHSQFLDSLSQAFGSTSKAEEFEHQWRLNYVDDKAIADLKALGFNSVRVPFHYNMFWENGSLSNKGFQYFDQIIEACRDQGIYVLLDMHAAPGYQNPGDHADNINSNASQPRDTVTFWDGNNVNIASSVWRHIADRYKNEPVIWGYDLINEPVPQPGREFELLGSLIAMRDAIREVDSNHVIVAEGSWWGSDLTKIDWSDPQVQAETGVSAQWDNDLVYQIHHYGPVSTTRGREDLTNNLNIPLIIGEYGETDPGNLAAITDWAKQELSGYFPWSFKKMSHDKTLWTIPPNNAYNEIKAFINNGGTPPTHLFDEMINFAQNNIRNGHSSHTWHQSFYDAVAPSAQVVQPDCGAAPVTELPGRIEAESFCQSSSLQTETTGDVEGGQNVGFISPGDWGEYNINVPSSGTYTLKLRTAGQATSGQIDVKVDGASIASVSTPVTGDWQSYQTMTREVTLSAGDHRLRLDFLTGGFNLNWIAFEAGESEPNPVDPCAGSPLSLPAKIEAENYCAMQGVQTEATADSGGGDNIGWIDNGDWTQYQLTVSESTDFTVTARVASQNGGGRMNIEIDGSNAGGIDIPTTGGWQNWQSIAVPITLSAGDHSVRFNFVSGGFNVNWIDFTEQSAPDNADLQAGTYVITNDASGKVLDVSGVSTQNGANVHQWDYSGGLNQQWLVEALGDGSYELVSLNSGSCLDADVVSDNVHQWSCQSNSNQRWTIERQPNGYYTILTISGEAVEVEGNSTVNGANIRTANLVQTSRQQWRFDLVN